MSQRTLRRIAYAVITVTILLVLGIALVNWMNTRDLVSNAYTEGRTIEPRFSGMGYAHYQKPPSRMGQEDDSTPQALSGALNEVTQLCSQRKADPKACQSKGRLLLLRNPKNWQAAVDAFEQAQDLGLNTPSLKIDFGVAQFLRASNSDSPYYALAIEEFRGVLEGKYGAASAEERKVALFNLALAYEQSASWDLAVSTWEDYPKDRRDGWADEARARQDTDKAKIPRWRLYTDPREFIRHASDPEVKNDIEQYQDVALSRWLLDAIQDPASDSAHAVRLVATMLAESPHFDPMWQDFLRSTGQADRLAVKALRDAFLANQNDQHSEALDYAGAAAGDFAKRGNVPGVMLAHFQEIYAQQRRLSAGKCLNAVDQLWPRAFATGYHWLQGQLALERAICANLAFSFEKVEPNFKISRDLSEKFRYPELQLRTMGMEAGIQRMNFAVDTAWIDAVEGLNSYWQHPYSSERLFQFYSVMRQIANDLNYPHAAVVFLRRTIEILEQNAPEDRALKALLYMRLANLLWEQEEKDLAETEAKRARELLSGSRTPYEVLALIELADFELRSGNPEQATTAIQPIGQELKSQDKFVQLDFYRVRGDIELQLKQLEQAQEDYQHGITLAEISFKHIKDDIKRLNWMASTGRIYRGMVQILLSQAKSHDALIKWEWSQSRILNHGFEATGPKNLQLPANPYPHLVYASFPDHLRVWLVRGSQITDRSIPLSREDLLKRVNAFNRNCGNPQSPRAEIDQQATELYKLLLQPVIGELVSSETVAIEFDSSIPPFSIEALRSPEGHYFGVDYATLHSPGIFAESALRRPEALQSDARFMVIDASPAEGPRFLPGHQNLTDAVLHTYFRAKAFRADGLTPAQVEQGLKGSLALLVISHARRNNKGVALEMRPDFYLRAQDFSPQLLKNLQVAVLAACSSGTSEKGALASDNLVRTLMAGGVPNVIASRWNVDSQSTVELFQNFYANLNRGETAAQALRDARRALLKRPDWDHPYFWAAFNLTGRSN
ncbi:MAG TPA: CHAT domain-containing protein [Candidatus Angelobacter sp.]